ncbi:MAG: YqgE/AlgH family protein [Muribaculaceae bacterium]
MNETDDIFHFTDDEPEPRRGCVMIAKPTVNDLCFGKSVIVLVSHNDNGSMGLMVNRDSGLLLNDVLPELLTTEDLPLYLGGPVDNNMLFFIHTLGEEVIPKCKYIAPGLYLGGEYDAMKRYINSGATVNGKMKFMLGYSGWDADQLKSEIEQHDWAICQQTVPKLLLSHSEYGLWQKHVEMLGQRYHLWQNWPYDLRSN